METHYVAKLNLEPETLELYEYSNLLEKVIPDDLSKIFSKNSEKSSLIKFEKVTNFTEIKSDEIYKSMLLLRQNLIEQYEFVSRNFIKTGEISYNKKYMGLRTELKKTIEKLFDKYPFLKSAEDLRIQSFSSGKTQEIQMGIVYIDRVEKIEIFLNNKIELKANIEFFYDTSNERIYISEQFLSEDNPQNSFIKLCEEIESMINTFQDSTDIGKVTVNPIYQSIEIKDGKYKDVTIIKVIPNGNPSKDRMKALNAVREETKYTAPKGETLEHTELEEEYNKDGQNGYISAILSRGKNILENKILKIKI